MAHSQPPFGPQQSPNSEEQSASESPEPSSPSESPRGSSVALSLIMSPTALYTPHEEYEDMSVVFKHEEIDDENLPIVKQEPGESSNSVVLATPAKRPRGRPRKHPKAEQPHSPKITKGRSKTGCLTCRKRKKKCDERKPECRNCEQNNVQCEGYPPRMTWQSGRQKALSQNRRRWAEQGPSRLPPYIPGIENDIDWKFYQHYNEWLSKRLNLSPEHNNPFVVHLLPMAQNHRGLMHAILACSGSHLLKHHGSIITHEMAERQDHHWSEAVKVMCRYDKDHHDPIQTLAQAVVHQLQTIVEGNNDGQWRTHVHAVRDMLNYQPKPDQEGAFSFFLEFFRYHDMSSFLTSTDPVTVADDELPRFFDFSSGHTDNFMAVCEGLDIMTRKIHNLRGRVRERRKQGQEPFVPYSIMEEGHALNQEFENIRCRHPVNSPEWICWHLYRTCIFLYLQRTIMTPKGPGESIQVALTQGIQYLQSMAPESPIQSLLLLPLFILGCCAWWEEDRPAILEALAICENYSHNGNILHARDILLRLWKMMDLNDSRVWDYEEVMKNDMGMDLLLT